METFTIKKTDGGQWDNPELLKYFRGVPIGKEIVITISDHEPKPAQEQSISFEKVMQDIVHLETLCGTQIDYTDPNAVQYLLNDLSSWLSYSGTVVANACLLNDQARKIEYLRLFSNPQFSTLSTTERKEFARVSCSDTEHLRKRAERINAAVTHRCDHLRTFLSYIKAELQTIGATTIQK